MNGETLDNPCLLLQNKATNKHYKLAFCISKTNRILPGLLALGMELG